MLWKDNTLVFLLVISGFSVCSASSEPVIVGIENEDQYFSEDLPKDSDENTILFEDQPESKELLADIGQTVLSEISEKEAEIDKAGNKDFDQKRRTRRQLSGADSLLESVSQECDGVTLRWIRPDIPFSLIYHNSNPAFSHYNIYRQTHYFTSVAGLKPIASGKDYAELQNIATNAWTDKYPPAGSGLFYAVTVVDHKGKETTTVIPKQITFFGSIEKTGSKPIGIISNLLNGDVLHHSVAYNMFRNEYMVAFDLDINKDGRPDHIYAVRVNGMGQVVSRVTLNATVNMKTTEQGRPSVAFNAVTRKYLIAFQLTAPGLFGGVSVIIGQRVLEHRTNRDRNPFILLKARNAKNSFIPIVEPKLIYNSGSGGFSMATMIIGPPKTALAVFLSADGKTTKINRLFKNRVFDINLFMDTKNRQVYFIFQIAQWATTVVDIKNHQIKSYSYLIAAVKTDANGAFLNLNTKDTIRHLVGYTNEKNAHIAGYYHENNGWLTVFWNNKESGKIRINSSSIFGVPGRYVREENANSCPIKGQVKNPASCFLPNNNGHILLWEEASQIGGFLVKDGTFGKGLGEQHEPRIVYNQREQRAFVVWKQKDNGKYGLFVRNVQPGSRFSCRGACKSKEKCAMLDVCVPRNLGAPKKQTCAKDNGGCSHTCASGPKGNPKCSCPRPYFLALDRQKCFLKAAKPDVSLLYSSLGSVWSVRVYYQEKRLSFTKVPVKGKQITSFYYNKKDKYLYWAEAAEKKIYRVALDGTKKKVIVKTQVVLPDGMVVDPDANQLYWTDAVLGQIFRSSLSGKNKLSFVRSLDKPRAIALHRQNKWLYWTSWGSVPSIERINTDGNGRRVLINTALIWPNGLTVDKSSIYWADAKLRKIEKSDLDGQNRFLISAKGIAHPYALAIAANRLFWTDWSGDIRTFNKNNPSVVEALVTGINKPLGLQIYDGTAVNIATFCDDPGLPSHGGRNPAPGPGGKYKIGDRVVLTCNPGFVHLGSNQRRCLPTGKWSGTDTQCKVLPVFTSSPRNKTVDAGSSVTLICSAEGKSGSKVKIHWLKNDKTIPPLPERYFLLGRTGHFFIISALVSDTGTYTCVASNDAGSVRASMYLLVKGKAGQQNCGIAKFPARAKIIGGHRATHGSIPWQVLLWDKRKNKPFCGGSLLNRHWGITAAHCLKHWASFSNVEAILGEHNWRADEKTEQQLSIDRVEVHAQYNEKTYDSDIALFHFSTGAIMTDYVKPICLPTTASDRTLLKPRKIGLISGWGARKSGKKNPVKTLHQVTVPLVSQSACEKNHPKYTVTSNMFCAGRTDGTGDACQGDSGGPLTIENKKTGRTVLIGIVSWGVRCGQKNKYGVYTKVPNYLNWINDRIIQK